MVGKILLAIFLLILFFAGIAFIAVVVAVMIITSGNRSIVIDAEIKEDKHEKDTDTD
jgi:hypothetical protein